MFIKKNL